MRRRESSRILVLVGASFSMLAWCLGLATAWAAPTTEIVQGEYLRIVSVADWQAAGSLAPGEVLQWDVTISAEAPEPGTVSIGVSASGGAALVVDAAACLQMWSGDECPGGASELRAAWDLPRDDAVSKLTDIADTDVAHLRLRISLASGTVASDGLTTVRVHASGAQETIVADPGASARLPDTGVSTALPALLAVALLMLILGAVLTFAAHLRRRKDVPEVRS